MVPNYRYRCAQNTGSNSLTGDQGDKTEKGQKWYTFQVCVVK